MSNESKKIDVIAACARFQKVVKCFLIKKPNQGKGILQIMS